MNDLDLLDGHDPHLTERMERAVGELRAPDVVPRAMALGLRQRRHRTLAYAGGGIAAATTLALTVATVATDWPGGSDPSGPSVAADPTTSAPAAARGTEDAPCGAAATGWWSKSSAQIKAELSARLPAGTRIGVTNDKENGTWGGNLVSDGDADFASLRLLPPPGTPGGWLTLAELAAGGPCARGSHKPVQPVKPCAELTGLTACEEIRSERGTLVGVVAQKVEQTVVNGQDQPTDKDYLLATVVGPEGGHVELYVAEGTRADRPHTVHDPADVPALTMDQAREIVTAAVWTS